MTITLETHEPLTEGPNWRHESEAVKDVAETSDLEEFAAQLAQTDAYRTMPTFL